MSNYTQQCEVCGKDLEGTGRPVHDECEKPYDLSGAITAALNGTGSYAVLTTNILRMWNRERIERFALHLLGDKAQQEVERQSRIAVEFAKAATDNADRVRDLEGRLAASEKEANKWFVLHQALEKEVERLTAFTPTPANINALPEPIRRYIHDIETRCDPAGDVAALTLTKDQNRQLEQCVPECEGLLRKCKTDGDEYTNEDGCAFCMMVPTDEAGPLKWKHVSTCIIVEIDAYFERRKEALGNSKKKGGDAK